LDAVTDWKKTDAKPADIIAAVEAKAERIDTPYERGTIAWRSFGDGPPLVLLHGGFGGWGHWLRNVGPLSRKYRVLAPDMPGFGDSGGPPEPFSPDAVADAVAAGIAQIADGKPVSIAGFSFGSVIGGLVTQRAHVPVDALVLVGAVAMGLKRDPMDLKSWRRAEGDAARWEAQRHNVAALMIYDPANIDELSVYLQDTNTTRTRVSSRPIGRSGRLRAAMEAIGDRVPLAGIWGEHDATAAPYLDERRALLHHIQPDAPFIVIPAVGHWVQYEAADQFNAALERALESARTRKANGRAART
jgi:pimeloyl-ACP methyl ester carboxylesterase